MFDRRTARVLLTIVGFALVLWLAYAARRSLVVLIFAVLFAYLLQPVVDWWQRWIGGSRLRAIALTYLALVALVAVFVLTVGPAIAQQGQRLVALAPSLTETVSSGSIARQVGERQGWSATTQARIESWISGHRDQLFGWVQTAGAHAAALATNMGWVVLVPILGFFVLKDKSCFADSFLELVRSDRNDVFWQSVVADVDRMLARYIRAQLVLSICTFVAFAIVLLAIGYPYALALAAVGGGLEFMPLVGPFMAGVTIVGVGLVSGAHWGIALAFVLVWRGVQDYVNTPYLMGEGLALHPLAIVFAILVGAEVAGIAGMYLSIPILAALRIVWHNWPLRHGTPPSPGSPVSYQLSEDH